MIYFVQADIVGRIKIGYTSARKVAERISNLQTACPVPLTLLATRKGGQQAEQRLHDRFAAARVHGEWFNPTPDLLGYVFRLQRRAGLPQPKLARRPSTLRALDFLREAADRQPTWTSEELLLAARHQNISRNALFRAKDQLGIPKPTRTLLPGGLIAWVWQLTRPGGLSTETANQLSQLSQLPSFPCSGHGATDSAPAS